MASDFDDLAESVDRHRRLTDDYVRVERQVQKVSLTPPRRRLLLLVMAFVLVATMPAAVLIRKPKITTTAAPPAAAVLAFPGAEGFGKNTSGGRGGSVIEVTNLNDSGTGSLRAALNATGTRTIVFRVGGVINLLGEVAISDGNVTIAGQTAPGDGIAVAGWHIIFNASNIMMRGMRIRTGDQYEATQHNDAVRIGKFTGGGTNFMIDHNSLSWATDENIDCSYTPQDITISNNITSEALMDQPLSAGGRMLTGYGMLISEGCKRVSIHHNLFASNNERNALFKGDTDAEFINNVIYNWRNYATHATNDTGAGPQVENVINNYYKPGPTGGGVNSNAIDWFAGTVYANGNFGASNIGSSPVAQQSGITPQSASAAFTSVLAGAGATAPARDSYDTRIVSEANSGTASLGTAGSHIGSQTEVGGMPTYASGTAPTDTDHDGMPDTWENANGLNPNDAADRNNIDTSGYTELEVYLNSLLP